MVTATEFASHASEDLGELQRIPLERIYPSPTNPRKHIDPEELARLADNIQAVGLLEPVILRPVEQHPADPSRGIEADSGIYEIVAGERRYRAHLILRTRDARRYTEVPSIVRNLSDEEVLEQQVSENLQRADLRPLDWAAAYRAMVDQVKAKQGDGEGAERSAVQIVAAKLGKSVSSVYQTMQLSNLIPEASEVLREGQMTESHAIDCARLSEEDQKRYLGEMFENWREDPVSVREMREWIAREVHHDIKAAPFPTDDASLLQAIGACKSCLSLAGNNRELFSEVKKKTTCTDANCYQRKTEAFIARQKEQAQSDSGAKKVIEISSLQYSAPKGALTTREYRMAKPESCEHVTPAVMVDGEEFGVTKHVCAEQKCKVHWKGNPDRSAAPGMYRAPRDPNSNEARARRLREMETKVRRVLMTKILGEVLQASREKKKLLTTLDLRSVALHCFKRLPNDQKITLGKSLGWEPIKANVPHAIARYETTAETKVPQMKRSQLALLLVACALASDLQIPGYVLDEKNITKLEAEQGMGEFAMRYGIDVAAIRSELKAEADAAKQAKKGGAR